MRKAKDFRVRLGEATNAKEVPGTSVKRSSTNDAMISLLPHHPKSVALLNESKEQPEEFDQLIDRFRFDLLSALRGQNRLMKHELCNALKLLENIIRLIDVSHVYYRLLMAINIFKNVKGTISDTEREQAKAGLFPSADKYTEETTKLIAEGKRLLENSIYSFPIPFPAVVAEIRSIVGMKQLHEAIATSWNLVRSDPGKLTDAAIVGSDVKLTRSYTPTEIQWMSPESELRSHSADPAPVSLPTAVNHHELANNADQPTSSSRNAGLKCADVMDSLMVFFPENHETITKHLFELLASDKTNNELQGELIDLLGFEQFEMVGQVLEARYLLADEMKAARQEATKLSKFAPEKLRSWAITFAMILSTTWDK
ncbi:hypothetical protein Aduo_006955 [Ancylostoma duodenale]